MDSIVDAALAAKLSLLFPPSDTSFLAFPLSGAAFTLEELDLFHSSDGTAEDDKQRSHRKAQFARVLNQIPQDSVIYEPTGTFLWGEYERVIDRAEVAESVLTPAERDRLAEARDFLEDTQEVEDLGPTTVYSPELKAYYQYKEAYEDAERAYLDEKISVAASQDPEQKRIWEESREAELDALRTRALEDWRTLGFRDQVREAQGVVASLGARSPEILRQRLQADFEACIELDLLSNDPNGVLSTFYSPSDIFDLDVPWETLRLTREEIIELHATAPERMRATGADGVDDIEEITLEYADVTIMRPWYDPAWFEMRTWRLPPEDPAVVSDGGTPRGGRVPAVIGSMVVARRVSVVRRGGSPTGEEPEARKGLAFAPLLRAQRLLQTPPATGSVTERPAPAASAVRRRATPVKLRANRRVVSAKQAGVTISRRRAPATVRADVRTAALAATVRRPTGQARTPLARRRVHLKDEQRPARRRARDQRARVRDHRTRDRPTERVPARRAAPPTEVEEVDLDCVVVLAYRCRRTPESPRPDPQLSWSGGPVPAEEPAPAYPLPTGHVFSTAGAAPSHNGKGSETDRELVRQVQERLAELGHQLDVDGYFGDETASVVREFQRSASLTVDGIVGPHTWSALWPSD